jgi:predicted metal-dependent phosphoesterase TrpH
MEPRKLKLDLHVHVFEQFVPGSADAITLRHVEQIVEKVKALGLDGIAITEHYAIEYGYRMKEMVATHFNNAILIIPGREVETSDEHIIELELPFDGTPLFRFLAHPGYPAKPADHIEGVQGIEIGNANHYWHIDKERVKEMASKYNLIMLQNSDAHYLDRIGLNYNEIALETLLAACKRP